LLPLTQADRTVWRRDAFRPTRILRAIPHPKLRFLQGIAFGEEDLSITHAEAPMGFHLSLFNHIRDYAHAFCD